jgi:hypothetical protein
LWTRWKSLVRTAFPFPFNQGTHVSGSFLIPKYWACIYYVYPPSLWRIAIACPIHRLWSYPGNASLSAHAKKRQEQAQPRYRSYIDLAPEEVPGFSLSQSLQRDQERLNVMLERSGESKLNL